MNRWVNRAAALAPRRIHTEKDYASGITGLRRNFATALTPPSGEPNVTLVWTASSRDALSSRIIPVAT